MLLFLSLLSLWLLPLFPAEKPAPAHETYRTIESGYHIVKLDPRRFDIKPFGPQGPRPQSPFRINANYYEKQLPIGAMVDKGKFLPSLPLKEMRGFLEIERGKARIGLAGWKDLRLRKSTIVQAGPLLAHRSNIIRSGEKFQPDIYRATTHTAVGVTAEGKLLLLYARNASLKQIAVLLVQHGAVSVLNLDGGSSASLRAAGRQMGNPSPRTGLAFYPR